MNDLESRIAQIWCDVLGIELVNPSADFFELGGHSLLAARLLARVEAVFGHRISMSALFESPGFTAFADLLRSPRQQNFDFRQVVRMGPRHVQRTIFAINNTGIFVTLSHRLSEDLSITALQLFDPWCQRDNLPATVEETAGQYVRLIREIQPRGPYVLMGWCNGGTLGVRDSPSATGGPRGCVARLSDRHVGSQLSQTFRLVSIETRGLLISVGADPDNWAKVRSERKSFRHFLANRAIIRRFYGRREIAAGLAEPVYAAAQTYDNWLLKYTTAMVKAYEPKPTCGRLTIFRSQSEPVGRFLDPKLGWDGMAEDVDLILVPGDHYKIFSEPGVSIMARCIEFNIRSNVDEAANDRFRSAEISASSRLASYREIQTPGE